ncbi:hypothetical protein AB0J75_19705, partial [Streptomyces sp. NPDC049744]
AVPRASRAATSARAVGTAPVAPPVAVSVPAPAVAPVIPAALPVLVVPVRAARGTASCRAPPYPRGVAVTPHRAGAPRPYPRSHRPYTGPSAPS